MKPDFRKCMIWLHTYSGLLFGWLLFAIFFTGTLSYFNHEISQWMKPELSHEFDSVTLTNQSMQYLQSNAQGADRWQIYLPNDRSKQWRVHWNKGRKRHAQVLDVHSGLEANVRETQGGNFFRIFHYTLQLRGYGGRYIAGVAAMVMLVALFSGIFTHRRFFRDFFTLRLSKLSKLLTDSHALVGVITLPFCIMICASGIIIYTTMYMPWGTQEYYKGGQREHFRNITPILPKLDKNAELAKPLTDFSIVEDKVKQAWPGQDQIASVTFEQPNRENGRIIIHRVKDQTLSSQSERLVFSSVTGEVLQGYPEQSTAVHVRRVFYGLHEAHFADTTMRWLFFVTGLLASAMIASGLIIWLKKRIDKTKKRHLGHFIVESLNVAGIAGLLVSVLVYFQANRWLPLDIEHRAHIEIDLFLWAWLASLIHSIFRSANKAWVEQLMLGAILCLSLPVVDVYQNSQFLLDALTQMNLTYLMFNIVIIITGVTLLKTALWLNRGIKSQHNNRPSIL